MPRTFSRLALPTSSLLTLLLIGGCPFPWLPNPPQQDQAKLVPFESPQDLLSYFKQQAIRRHAMRSYNFPMFGIFGGMAPGADLATEAGGEQAASDGEQEFSTTNLQEVGVDEADVFKSDGTYFYIAKGSSLRIVRAAPPDQLAEVGRLDLENPLAELYLYDQTAIALASRWGERYGAGGPELLIWPPYYPESSTFVYQIDVSDPENPTLVAQVELEGNLVESRLVNDRLIVVLTIVPDLPENPTQVSIAAMTLDDVMPRMRRGDASESDMIPWQHWLRPTDPNGYDVTAVVTLDAADVETEVGSVAVMADAGTVYASQNAVYITDTDYNPDGYARELTAVHKLVFNEDGAAEYAASGSVPGRPLNQFSLSEYEGYLRIATHVTDFGWRTWQDMAVAAGVAASGQDEPAIAEGDETTTPDTDQGDSEPPPLPSNGVYVMSQENGVLEVVGSVEGIAPNEDLHAARFLGDHGFLVTFRKIDPLFVIDLTDPTNPLVVGELEVPGFSDYLHPIDEHHLVGVGKYTVPTEDGFDWFQGIQISLFDVSDWSNPVAVQQLTLGGRGSYAETDNTHKAFTYMESTGRLALPVHVYSEPESEDPWDYGQLEFVGVIVFQVDPETGFTELGRLESITNESDAWWGCCQGWQRAAFIGDTVYAITPAGVSSAPVADFASTLELVLEDGTE